MYDKKSEARAAAFGIQDKLRTLESDLLKIEGVSDIDFDIDNFDEIPQVILIPKYDAGPLDGSYYDRRSKQLLNILRVCSRHDLHKTGDMIEDYGEHWYIVRSCGKTWKEIKA